MASKRQSLRTTGGDEHLEALTAGQVGYDPGVVLIVLYDQKDRVVRLKVGSIVNHFGQGVLNAMQRSGVVSLARR